MNNIEKVKKSQALVSRIENFTDKVNSLENILDDSKRYSVTAQIDCNSNRVHVTLGPSYIKMFIEEYRRLKEISEKELDQLLNGETDKLKEKFSIFAEEIKECEEKCVTADA